MNRNEVSNDFTPEELNRYSRTMLLKEVGSEGQVKLQEARVLIAGAGGLASPAALYLAATGVGTIGIADFDSIDLSNLNRQVMHGTPDVGRLKTDSARDAILRINPHVNVVTLPRITMENAMELLEGFQIVLDAVDSAETKFLLNDACFFLKKPYVFGGAVHFEGQASLFHPAVQGPCLRCLFPKPPPKNLVPSCNEVGVLGMVPGQIGLVQATEVVKHILGIGKPMIGRFFVYDALEGYYKVLSVDKNPNCPLCGERPTITSLAFFSSPST
jgi:sulfur-carrier protein adenylyltransferase/sulfurtransferase